MYTLPRERPFGKAGTGRVRPPRSDLDIVAATPPSREKVKARRRQDPPQGHPGRTSGFAETFAGRGPAATPCCRFSTPCPPPWYAPRARAGCPGFAPSTHLPGAPVAATRAWPLCVPPRHAACFSLRSERPRGPPPGGSRGYALSMSGLGDNDDPERSRARCSTCPAVPPSSSLLCSFRWGTFSPLPPPRPRRQPSGGTFLGGVLTGR